MATESKESKSAAQSVIAEVRQDLGAPHDRNETIKESLLKIRVGDIISNLGIAQRFNEKTGAYLPPEPTYSLGYMEKIRKVDGSIESKYNSIPVPKNSADFRALGEHFLMVAEATVGIEFKSSAQEIDDLDNALSRLKQFKTGEGA